MGYYSTPKQGSDLAPCEPTCQHRDCAANRTLIEGPCAYCGQPIGYDTAFVYLAENRAAHNECDWQAVERGEELPG